MKKKSLFIILFIMCIGLFIPNEVFALKIYNNISIDYRFSASKDNAGGKYKYKLYDKSGTLNFKSRYNSNDNYYYFESNEYEFHKESYPCYEGWFGGGIIDGCFYYEWHSNDVNYNGEGSFRKYIPFHDELNLLNYSDHNLNDFVTFANNHGYSYNVLSTCQRTYSYYTYIPLILENEISGDKNIVLAALGIRNRSTKCVGEGTDWHYFNQLLFVNNTIGISEEPNIFGDGFSENVEFMRKAVYKYSDELWDRLNFNPIASSEINFDYSSVVNNNTDLSLPSVIQFNTQDESDIDSSDKERIIKKVVNPKTWNNGISVLIISMIIICGSSYLLIKKKG